MLNSALNAMKIFPYAHRNGELMEIAIFKLVHREEAADHWVYATGGGPFFPAVSANPRAR